MLLLWPTENQGAEVLICAHFAKIPAIGSVADPSRRAPDRLLWLRSARAWVDGRDAKDFRPRSADAGGHVWASPSLHAGSLPETADERFAAKLCGEKEACHAPATRRAVRTSPESLDRPLVGRSFLPEAEANSGV